MIRLEQALPGTLPQLTAFAQAAFQTPGGGVEFEKLLPKLYAPGAGSEPMHTLLYDGNTPVGMFCLQVQIFLVAGNPLKVGWLGTVAVSPEHRGKGHLEQLMEHANGLLAAVGCDLGVLGGQRQRYERFGYEPAGQQWEFTISPRNLRGVAENGVSLCPLADRADLTEQAMKLYRSRPVRCERGDERRFVSVLQSWGSLPLALLQHQKFAGYCTLAKEGGAYQTLELDLTDSALLPGCLAALVRQAQDQVRVQVYPWQTGVLQGCAALAEQSRCAVNHSYKVLNWENTTRAALALRKACALPAPTGTFVLEIETDRKSVV